jgi:hypothetical protein
MSIRNLFRSKDGFLSRHAIEPSELSHTKARISEPSCRHVVRGDIECNRTVGQRKGSQCGLRLPQQQPVLRLVDQVGERPYRALSSLPPDLDIDRIGQGGGLLLLEGTHSIGSRGSLIHSRLGSRSDVPV